MEKLALIWHLGPKGAERTLVGVVQPGEDIQDAIKDLKTKLSGLLGVQEIELGDYHHDGVFDATEIDWN